MNVFFEKVMDGDVPAMMKVATVWFLFFTVKFHLELRAIAKWPSTIGNLTHFDLVSAQRDEYSLLKLRYNFTVAGVDYTGRRLAHLNAHGKG